MNLANLADAVKWFWVNHMHLDAEIEITNTNYPIVFLKPDLQAMQMNRLKHLQERNERRERIRLENLVPMAYIN